MPFMLVYVHYLRYRHRRPSGNKERDLRTSGGRGPEWDSERPLHVLGTIPIFMHHNFCLKCVKMCEI